MHNAATKRTALLTLARQRQADRIEGYGCLADFNNGFYECDYVVPWTKSACNVDASLMIVGQDWASSNLLSEKDEEMATLGRRPKLATNKRIEKLLAENDLPSFEATYATDVFPFIKNGGMSERIRSADFVACARKYALPQIEIVGPRIVVCLGLQTYNGLRKAMDLPPVHNLDKARDEQLIWKGSKIRGVGHPGAWASKRMVKMTAEWAALGTLHKSF